MKLKEKISKNEIHTVTDILRKYEIIQSELENKTTQIKGLTEDVQELGEKLKTLREIELSLYMKMAEEYQVSKEEISKAVVELITQDI